ncbi:MAG: phospholipid carrier-dependent glycosyltransferase [Hyphomicrobium sp.]
MVLIGESPRRGPLLLMLTLFAGALFVRLVGVDWQGRHPDEDVSGPAKILSGELTPTQHYYPPLLTYLVAVAFVALYAMGRVAGWWASLGDFRASYFIDKTPFLVSARFVVAMISATAAPLTYVLARQLKLSEAWAFACGALIALAPGAIFWAHIAKSDSGLAPAYLLTIVTALYFLDDPQRMLRQIALAFAIALTVSFKHSGVFFLLPLAALVAARLLLNAPRPLAVKALAQTAALSFAFWIPMNFGVLLDLRGFWDAQIVQAQMSLRSGGFASTAHAWLTAMTSLDAGIPAAVLALGLAIFPACMWIEDRDVRWSLLAIGLSVIAVILLVVPATGERQPTQLWLPYGMLVTAAVLLTAAHFAQSQYDDRFRVGGLAVFCLVGALLIARSGTIVAQALEPPMAPAVADAVRRAAPSGSRLLTNMEMAPWLQVSSKGAAEWRERHERLAKKYNVTLPPVAQESLTVSEDGYTVFAYPFAIGGMEVVDAEAPKAVIAFAWPIQVEEWTLPYWRERGYSLFVVQGPFHEHSVAVYANFFREIMQTCSRVATVPTTRPLFFEAETNLYDCRKSTTAEG